MSNPTESITRRTLDEIVEAYELACTRGNSVDVATFMPTEDHPEFASVCRELLCVDLERHWQPDGAASSVEIYRKRFPHVMQHAAVVQQVAFEEYRLRCQRGDLVDPQIYADRYQVDTSRWPRSQVAEPPASLVPKASSSILFRASSRGTGAFSAETALVGSTAVERPYPSLTPERLAPGEQVLEFQIVQLLGEGKFGRVYLARQGSLAGRLVVIKISTSVWRESERLARLQHTHVVPIYSVHQDPPFQLVCMPFLGSVTLSDLLRIQQRQGRLDGARFLQHLREAAEQVVIANGLTQSGAVQGNAPTSTAQYLQGRSHEDLCVWIAARIAEGLAHAHERGILHRDLKPANVLITDDGTPMILDFNLAADQADGAERSMVGGTLPYMAPEQLRAVMGGGTTDARSDIYSLGVVLYQLLTGELPFSTPAGSVESVVPELLRARTVVPRLRACDPQFSYAIESIVQRCLEPVPDQRYASAHELVEDLNRHIQNLPLRYAPNPSRWERTVKWWRRHPRLTSAGSLAAIAGVLLIALGGMLSVRSQQVARLRAGETWNQFQAAAREATAGLSLLGTDPAILHVGADAAHQALQLFHLDQPNGEGRAPFRWLGAPEQARVRETAREIYYLLAADGARRAALTISPDARHELIEQARAWNRMGQQLTSSAAKEGGIFAIQAEELQDMPGKMPGGELVTKPVRIIRGGDSGEWLDRYLMTVHAVGHEEYEQAIPRAEALTRERPKDIDAWLLLGHAYAAKGRLHDAELCYTHCSALWPSDEMPYYFYFFRGVSRLSAAKDAAATQGAEADFTEVLRQRPQLAAARVNRALARIEQKRFSDAIEDLTEAMGEGEEDCRWYLLRSRCWLRMGEATRAAEDRARGLALTPRDEEGWISRGLAHLPEDPAAAKKDLEQARRLFPHSRRVLQNLAHILADQLQDADGALAVLDQMLTIDPADATALAGRGVILARRGDREPAVRDASQALQAGRQAPICYQVACIYALLAQKSTNPPAVAATPPAPVAESDTESSPGTPPTVAPGGDGSQGNPDRHRAVSLLAEALRQDPAWLPLAVRDPDLAALRDDPSFQAVLRAVAALQRPPVAL